MRRLATTIFLGICISMSAIGQIPGFKDGYIQNEDVKIHYVTKGEGPVMIFLHGFPDFWFTWKYQMEALSKDYKVVGMDLRAYNHSEGPEGAENYQMRKLMSDLVALIDHLSDEPVTLVANDWGGAIAWLVTTFYPAKVKYLIACNIPNPTVLSNHLKESPRTGTYTEAFKGEEAVKNWTPEKLLGLSGAKGTDLETEYLNAFKRSNIKGMLNYYNASYPKSGGSSAAATPNPVNCPVLMIHGLKDTAFPPASLNNHWELVPKGLTIKTIPDVGHFVQRAAPEKVLKYIKDWLEAQK